MRYLITALVFALAGCLPSSDYGSEWAPAELVGDDDDSAS